VGNRNLAPSAREIASAKFPPYDKVGDRCAARVVQRPTD
jgi:hypothetical protein